jgi:hypothetical protein
MRDLVGNFNDEMVSSRVDLATLVRRTSTVPKATYMCNYCTAIGTQVGSRRF